MEARWQAVLRKDGAQDGAFVYGVLTTGVYCRPGCASRTPRRENVRFFNSPAEAEAAGLRACKRCKPDACQGRAEAPDRMWALCRYLEEHADEAVTLEQLGERAGLSPHHLQRTFKRVVGVSPKQYAEHLRMERFKLSVKRNSKDVTGAIFDAGYSSLSRLYEKVDTRLGMTPMEYRGGGAGVEISYAAEMTPVGLMMVGATDRGLCFVQFGDDADTLLGELRKQYPKAEVHAMAKPAPAAFGEWMAGLNEYLAGQRPDLRLPVHVRATAFQLMVWNHLQRIPAGEVQSYQEVAQAIGQPRASRAVARACASNNVALAIPCHRVIRGTGEMGGYRWGVGRKRALLHLERSAGQ
ncbi:MAG: bifunctional DNA-binding transcriptional regulator/O6-methylguanine-DNA methyltransferase Ada [Acidobacteria bacterium]|nr:bifunctional DNA-binding transcriptional regulator/O6-methylguanine-DNA methyltransferase Ada [Acidobacteriota bacterium]